MPTPHTPNPPIADERVWRRCMQLRDACWPLRTIAQQLVEEGLLDRVPSPESVRTWAAKGEDAWEEEARQVTAGRPGWALANSALLNRDVVRPEKARRYRRLIGDLDQAVTQGNVERLELLARQIDAQVKLEKLEAELVGTDAPKTLRHEIAGAALHAGTAAIIDATDLGEPPPPPKRRRSG